MSTALTPYERKQTIKDFLTKNRSSIEESLPTFMTAERLIGHLMTNINANPKLLECTPRSLIGALLYCGSLGLEPSPLGHVYLIPFANRNRGTTEVQIIVGYKGLAMLARRSNMIDTINSGVVYQGDQFDYELGTRPWVKHKHDPNRLEFGNPDDIEYVWASYRIKGSDTDQVTVLTKNNVLWHRDRYSKAKADGPWVNNFEAMAMKTAVRINLKLAPMETSLHSAIALDELAESQLSQSSFMPELPDALDAKLRELDIDQPDESQGGEVDAQVVRLPQWAPTALKGKAMTDLTITQLKSFVAILKKRLSGATVETNPRYEAETLLAEQITGEIQARELGAKTAPVDGPGAQQAPAAKPQDSGDEEALVVDDTDEKSSAPKVTSSALATPDLRIQALKMARDIAKFDGGREAVIEILNTLEIPDLKAADRRQCQAAIQEFQQILQTN